MKPSLTKIIAAGCAVLLPAHAFGEAYHSLQNQ
jgi:hypothetical protein